MVEITREPLTLLSDITDAVPYFFGKDVEIQPEAQTGTLDTETAQSVLPDFVAKKQKTGNGQKKIFTKNLQNSELNGKKRS